MTPAGHRVTAPAHELSLPQLQTRLRRLLLLLTLALALALALALLLAHGLTLIPAWPVEASWPWWSHLALLAAVWLLAGHREQRLRQQIHALKQALDETRARQTASAERRRLALDLHDGAIQPYIGLKLALEALQMQAGPGHPLAPGLQRIIAMTEAVINDLRQRAQRLRQAPSPNLLCLRTELEQQARQMQQFHGLDVALETPRSTQLDARLHEEVALLVREGLSNIRRHTPARKAQVRVDCKNGWLGIHIVNQAPPGTPLFTPKSITERARALGGRALVCMQANGRTAVQVRLPV